MCDRLKPHGAIAYSVTQDACIGFYNAEGEQTSATTYIAPDKETITTLAQVQAWLADNPVTFVYPLAEPLIYQLTAQEVDTLVGQNYIWASTGDVTVTYRG